jgi:hypothetical protein
MVRLPPKGQKKKKIMSFDFWGWSDHPLRPWGEGALGQGGGRATSKGQKKKKKKKMEWVLAFWDGQTIPLGHGGGSAIPAFSFSFFLFIIYYLYI